MPKYVPKDENKEATEDTEPKEEKVKGKGKGTEKKGGDGETPARKSSVLTKTRALAQIASLDEDDDEREATSKKISWILRKGASRIGINCDNNGWIKFADLLSAELLDDVPDRSEEKLMSVIDESNAQKLRYELKDSDAGKMIRALKKEERKSKAGTEPGAAAGKKEVISLAAQSGLTGGDTRSGLRGDAPSFVPAVQAAAAASTMAGYSNPAAMQYPGWNPYAGYGQQAQMQAMMWAQAQAAAYAGATQGASKAGRFQGRIKSFNTEKGYGFIESQQASAIHGRDVFLHKAHVGSYEVGALISFTVETNKEGMPQARDIGAADGSFQPAKGKGKGKGKKDGKGKKGDAKGEKKEKPKKDKADGEKAEGEGEGEAKAAPADTDKPADAPAPAADADKS